MLGLAAYHPGSSITSITQKLNFLLTELMDLRSETGNISFCDIRRCLLSLENHSHSFVYYPPEIWDVAVGDIGYIRDNAFVCLYNARDHATLQVTREDISDVKCDPPRPISTDRISTELIRYV